MKTRAPRWILLPARNSGQNDGAGFSARTGEYSYGKMPAGKRTPAMKANRRNAGGVSRSKPINPVASPNKLYVLHVSWFAVKPGVSDQMEPEGSGEWTARFARGGRQQGGGYSHGS
jgi:hypothetical protein